MTQRRTAIVDQIKRLEHQADQVTHEVVTRLDRVFITPLDREDIHLLASRLDDVMDLIDGTARRLLMFHAGKPPEGAVLIADVIGKAVAQLQAAVGALEKNKGGTVLAACVQVKRMEEEGDSLYHEWLARLFDGQPDPLDGDQVEGDLRQPGEDARHHRGCGQRAGVHLHQARLSMDGTIVYVLVIVAHRAHLRFHQRLSRQRQLHRHRGVHPGAHARGGGLLGRLLQLHRRLRRRHRRGQDHRQGLIDIDVVDPSVILGGLIGAIVWDLITWWGGIPSSSSHALLGGYAGAAIAKAGFGALIPGGWTLPLALHRRLAAPGHDDLPRPDGRPVLAALRNAPPGPVDRVFRRLQLVSAGLYSLCHGANDAQKTMGIIVSLLVASQAHFAGHERLAEPFLSAQRRTTSRSGSCSPPTWPSRWARRSGGWRIVKTMGSRITKLRPFGGFCAETAGGITVLLATSLGVPVSTTHTITGAIVGVGAAQRVSAVRWGVAGRIVWAWILTIPMSAAIAAIAYLALHQLSPVKDRGHAARVNRFPSTASA